MRPERWRQVDEIFQAALECAPADRPAFLDRLCDGDSDLRREVQLLLSSDQEAVNFIEAPAVQMAAPLLVEDRAGSLIGYSFGHYQIISLLGQGGMGEVYAARDTRLDRQVALKFLPADLDSDPARARRFQHEAKVASALNHPNVATIFEIGEAEGRRFIAMEHVSGETLAARIAAHPLSVPEVLDIGLQIGEALKEAHGIGITHRDIKPANVMTTPRGQVKVLDFGLAKMRSAAEHVIGDQLRAVTVTSPGAILGTPQYMSPEQARGEEMDHRSDIFSFGAVMYEMATGQPPFKLRSHAETMNAVINVRHKPVGQLNEQVPLELATVIDRALAKEPRDRYQSMADLLDDLRRIAQSLRVAGGVSFDSAARTSLGWRLWLFASAGALLIIGLVAYFLVNLTQSFNSVRQPPQRTLTRLTFDAGLQSEPTWSSDGRFIAYSSDKSGNFDIWVQPVGGGDAVPVTRSPAHDWQPDWSPDGSQIVFRSERDGGGLFVVPALGGREHKIAPMGYHPRWSPDGTKVLFSNLITDGGFAPKIHVVSLDGSAPQEVQSTLLADFVMLWSLMWHPDGRISLWGERRTVGHGLWTVPLVGGTPVKSELSPEVQRRFQESALWTSNFRWANSGRVLYFEGVSRGLRNLWKITVDPHTLRLIAGPERLTTGFNDTAMAPSPDGQRLAFTARTESTRAWSLPFDARTGEIKADGQPLTAIGISPDGLNLSRDGKHLLYVAHRAGTNKVELFHISLEENRETVLTENDEVIATPVWSRDGTRVVYGGYRPAEKGRGLPLLVLPAGGGDEQVLASGAEELVWDWSRDGQWLLVSSDRDSPRRFGVLALYPLAAAPHAETQKRVITSHPEFSPGLFEAQFSADDRWVAFQATKSGDNAVIYVVPTSGGEWTRISEENVWSDKPHWSPDGRTIYYLSNRVSGFFDVWGIRFDQEHGRPIGAPFRVTSLVSPGRMLSPRPEIQLNLSGDRLVLPITEVTGSIWVLDGAYQ